MRTRRKLWSARNASTRQCRMCRWRSRPPHRHSLRIVNAMPERMLRGFSPLRSSRSRPSRSMSIPAPMPMSVASSCRDRPRLRQRSGLKRCSITSVTIIPRRKIAIVRSASRPTWRSHPGTPRLGCSASASRASTSNGNSARRQTLSSSSMFPDRCTIRTSCRW